MPVLWTRQRPWQSLLQRLWCGPGPGGPPACRHALGLHAAAPRHAHPDLAQRPRGRTEAGHRALRRPQGLSRAPGRPRPRGSPTAARPRARADDGGRPPVRGNRQPGDGRRDHGAVRRPPGPRGSCPARLLRGAPDAGARGALWRRDAAGPRDSRPDPGRPQLRRGGRARDQQRPAHGLLRGRADHAPGRPDGTDRQARFHPHDVRFAAARRGLRPRETARPGRDQGPRGAGRGVRASGGVACPDTSSDFGRPRAHALRGARRRAWSAARGPRARQGRPWSGGRPRRRAGRRQVAAGLGARALPSHAGVAGPGDDIGRLWQGDAVPARHRSAPALFRGGGPRRCAPGPREADRTAPHAGRGPASGRPRLRVAAGGRCRGVERRRRGAAPADAGRGQAAAAPRERAATGAADLRGLALARSREPGAARQPGREPALAPAAAAGQLPPRVPA